MKNYNTDYLMGRGPGALYQSAADGAVLVGVLPQALGGLGVDLTTGAAKGDIFVTLASGALARLAVSGTNGNVLKENSSTTTGLEWGAAGGGGMTTLTNGGTNADLSATGGAKKFLAQAADHTVSVREIVAADIAGLAMPLLPTNKTASYTVTSADQYLRCEHATVAIDLTMYAASGTGNRHCFKNRGAAVVTLLPNGSDTFDGSASVTIPQWGSVEIIDGASGQWDVQ